MIPERYHLRPQHRSAGLDVTYADTTADWVRRYIVSTKRWSIFQRIAEEFKLLSTRCQSESNYVCTILSLA